MMYWFFALCAFAGVTSTSTEAYPVRFQINSLPGYVDEAGNPLALPSRHFTGFLPAGIPPSGSGTMYFHYWMVESEGNPSTDPVVFWYNGGPGASSLFGMLQEFGPLLITETSYDSKYLKTGIPSPIINPARWTKNHTIIAIDSPPPMGLSFCSDAGPGGDPLSCGPWTDTTVFAANHKAHISFFTLAFPELKTNPVYFTGESYAGIYVPGFVQAWLNDPIPGVKLAGFAVGDGWTGCAPAEGRPINWCLDLDNVGVFKYPNVYPGPYYDIDFFHGHSQFSEELYRSIKNTCSEAELRGTVVMSTACSGLIDEMSNEVGYFYAYNLYNECPAGASDMRKISSRIDKHGINRALASRRLVAAQVSGKQHYSGLSSPCLGNVLAEWLLTNATLAAIGAPLNSNFINLDNGHGFNYTSDQSFVGDIYKQAIDAGLRVMVYEGDNDACGLQTQPVEDIFEPLFSHQLGLTKTRKWRPFTTDGRSEQVGYWMEWEKGRIKFVSVRGSGHLLPLNRPYAAETMIIAFTRGQPLPPYAPAGNKEEL